MNLDWCGGRQSGVPPPMISGCSAAAVDHHLTMKPFSVQRASGGSDIKLAGRAERLK
jgi:hypothetical protein